MLYYHFLFTILSNICLLHLGVRQFTCTSLFQLVLVPYSYHCRIYHLFTVLSALQPLTSKQGISSLQPVTKEPVKSQAERETAYKVEISSFSVILNLISVKISEETSPTVLNWEGEEEGGVWMKPCIEERFFC